MREKLFKKRFVLMLAAVFMLLAVPVSVSAASFKLDTKKNVITNNTAKVYTNLTKAKGQKVTTAGIYVWEKGTKKPAKPTYAEGFKGQGYFSARTSLPIQYQIGDLKEVNIPLASGKTYYYQICCAVNARLYLTPTGSFTMPKTVSFSLNAAKNSVTQSKTKVVTSLKKKSGQKVTYAGIYVWKKGSAVPTSATYYENYKAQGYYSTKTSLPIQYLIGKGQEVNYGLAAGQTYNYRIYTVIDGVRYWTPYGTFTVPKQAAAVPGTSLKSKSLSVKVYNQTLSKYKKVYLHPKNKKTSLYSIGCLTCAYATLQSYHEKSITPEAIAKKLSYSYGGYMQNNYITKKYKTLCSTAAKVNLKTVYNYIKAGKPVLAGMVKKASKGSSPFHWVVIYGYKNVKVDAKGNPVGLTPANFMVADSGYKYGGKLHSLNDYYTKNASCVKVLRARK